MSVEPASCQGTGPLGTCLLDSRAAAITHFLFQRADQDYLTANYGGLVRATPVGGIAYDSYDPNSGRLTLLYRGEDGSGATDFTYWEPANPNSPNFAMPDWLAADADVPTVPDSCLGSGPIGPCLVDAEAAGITNFLIQRGDSDYLTANPPGFALHDAPVGGIAGVNYDPLNDLAIAYRGADGSDPEYSPYQPDTPGPYAAMPDWLAADIAAEPHAPVEIPHDPDASTFTNVLPAQRSDATSEEHVAARDDASESAPGVEVAGDGTTHQAGQDETAGQSSSGRPSSGT